MIAQAAALHFTSTLMKSGRDLTLVRGVMKGRNRRCRRPAPASLDHGVHLVGRSGEHRLDRAIGQVSHPAIQTKAARNAYGPATIPDALDSPLDPNANRFPIPVDHPLPKTGTSRL